MGFGYKIYFTERARNRVVCWDPDVGTASVVAGDGVTGQAAHQRLNSPYGLALDYGGHVVIADKMNHRLVRLTNQLDIFSGRNQGRAHRLDHLRTPTSLCRSKKGTYLVAYADEYGIFRVNEQGDRELVLGAPVDSGYVFPGYESHIPEARVKQTLLNFPTGVVEAVDGTIYFIERGFQAVRAYRPGQGIRGLFPLGDCTPFAVADRQTIAEYRASYPTGLALLANGDLLISDSLQRSVMQVKERGQVVECIYRTVLEDPKRASGPAAVTQGPDGTVWVLDHGEGLIIGLHFAAGHWKRVASRCSTLREQDAPCAEREGAGLVCV